MVVQEGTEVHTLHVHMHVIGVVINIIVTAQLCFAALVLRIAVDIYAHGFQVHCCCGEVSPCSEFIRTDVQTAAGDTIMLQVGERIAVDSVRRQIEFSQREGKTAHVQLSRIIHVRTYIHQGIGSEIIRPDIQS